MASTPGGRRTTSCGTQPELTQQVWTDHRRRIQFVERSSPWFRSAERVGWRRPIIDGRERNSVDETTRHRIRSLAIPPALMHVWICSDPNRHLQAVGRDARGRKQCRGARTKAYLGLHGLSTPRVLATVVELLEKFPEHRGRQAYPRADLATHGAPLERVDRCARTARLCRPQHCTARDVEWRRTSAPRRAAPCLGEVDEVVGSRGIGLGPEVVHRTRTARRKSTTAAIPRSGRHPNRPVDEKDCVHSVTRQCCGHSAVRE